MPLWPTRRTSIPQPGSPNATNSGPASPPPPSLANPRAPFDGRPDLRHHLYSSSPGIPTTTVPFGSSPPKPPKHVRSKSQTFPSFLGGSKKKEALVDSDEGFDLENVEAPPPKAGPFLKNTSGKARVNDKDLESYMCATCAGTVRQPKRLTHFRCTACMMVNDLVPMASTGSSSTTNGTYAVVAPLSIERTRAIIKSCIGDFWTQRQRRESTSRHIVQTVQSSTQPHMPAPSVGQTSPVQQSSESTFMHSPSRIFTRKPVSAAPTGATLPIRPRPIAMPSSPKRADTDLKTNDGPTSPQEHDSANKRIFKPLEEYFINSFKGADCVNASFLISRSAPLPRLDHADEAPRPSIAPSRIESSKADTTIWELDAKTLLLGDVAENGMWWTGRDKRATPRTQKVKPEKSSDPLRADNHSRSLNINRIELDKWYEAVVNVGDNWRDILRELRQDKDVETKMEPGEALELDRAMAEARNHTQRMLLKASEGLLKRPGRPLQKLEDIRFLLILLANPMMYSEPPKGELSKPLPTSTHIIRQAGFANSQRIPSSSAKPAVSRSPEHFVVLRRILGLLSNVHNEHQRHIAAWFARYDEKTYRILVELIETFLTHRLGRQSCEGRARSNSGNPPAHLIPEILGSGVGGTAQLHAALALSSQPKTGTDNRKVIPAYSDDWSTRSAAKVLALLYAANRLFQVRRVKHGSEHIATNQFARNRGRQLAESDFYNTMVEFIDLVGDFEMWEKKSADFTFCQYPFLLSMGAKIKILEYDARRQMEGKASEAFFNSILRNRAMEPYLTLRVRRDCLVEDSLKSISEVIGAGQEEIKKGLKIQFMNEEGIDAGGLRKEWFLLLIREIFDPNHGMFVYDEDSRLCYFNPHSFETSDQYYLVGALLGLAIYNSTILDVALPPFVFKKLLTSSSSTRDGAQSSFARFNTQHTLEDLAEYKPTLAEGLRRLLEFDGNVEETFCRDFVITEERYGHAEHIPLCTNGASRPVTNSNRQEFVDLYIRYELDTRVARQFEPFKRGFSTVCGGNALSLFQPEEIEQLIRGSDEALDVNTLKGVAIYENFRRGDHDIANPAEQVALVRWFWDFFTAADPKMQRRLLSFITGSDRIPAVGAASLVIKVVFGGKDAGRYPVARTCFNSLRLYAYATRQELEDRLTRAVVDSEGFGLA